MHHGPRSGLKYPMNHHTGQGTSAVWRRYLNCASAPPFKAVPSCPRARVLGVSGRRLWCVVRGCSGLSTLCAISLQPNKLASIGLRYSSDHLCRILRIGQGRWKAASKAAESPSTLASIQGSPGRGNPDCRLGSSPRKIPWADQSLRSETMCTTSSLGRFLAGIASGSCLTSGFGGLGQGPDSKAKTQ